MISIRVGDGSTPGGAPEKTFIVVEGGRKRLVELMDIDRSRSCEERLRDAHLIPRSLLLLLSVRR